MEDIGTGFLIGFLGGAVIVLIVAVILAASRRAMREAAPPPALTSRPPPTGKTPPPERQSVTRTADAPRSGHTVIVEEMDSRETQLNGSVHQIRDLLLRLADIISTTESASGKASQAFTSAKNVVDNVDLSRSDDLAEAQRILIKEIDRVLKTNIALHSELDQANQGIAEQRRQIEELRLQARIDSLTRIPNRAALDERLKEYVALFDRNKVIFSVLLLDIDHFKLVNDQHGHINGDRILRGVASKISDSIRANDFAARYGGEEFAVIFPGTGLKDAMLVSDRMRQDIARTNFRLDDKNVKMTVSGGLVECETGMGAEAVISAADKALYMAKNTGRNRVVAAAPHEEKADM